MPYGFIKAVTYVSLTTTCAIIGSIAGPGGIAVGLVSGAALAKVSMKRNPREKEMHRKEVEEREAKQERIKEQKRVAKQARKEKRKIRGTFSSEFSSRESESESKEERIDNLYRTMKEWRGLANSNRLTRC